jgi:rod shape-determining protein MreD
VKEAAGVLLAIVVALALQTTLARFVIRGTLAVDLVLVVVVYVSLTSGAVTGLLSGAAAGLAQDVLSTSVIGIGGLAKTIVGFLVGIAGSQFIVTQPFPRFVIFFAATLLHAGLFIGLYVLLDLRQFESPYAAVLGQGVGNAVTGVVAFELVDLIPRSLERRRAQRARIRR